MVCCMAWSGLYPEVRERVGVTPSKSEQPLPGLATNLDPPKSERHMSTFVSFNLTTYLTFPPGGLKGIFNFLMFWSKPIF